MGDVFRTFCHINEYGPQGYAKLHRLIATSSPLVLWGPASGLILSKNCLVTGEDFVNLVDNGKIHVVGRHDWLMDRSFHDGHPWGKEARWNASIDDSLRSMAKNDAAEPLLSRRVAVADAEDGEGQAATHLRDHPELIEVIHRALLSPTASQEFPAGVVETALRYGDAPEALAQKILRDAYNHEAAIKLSGAHVPFLLEPRESQFNRLVHSMVQGRMEQEPSTPAKPTLSLQAKANLTDQVLVVLEQIETRRTDLRKFMSSDGHQLLTLWMSDMCEALATTRAGDVDGVILAKLQREFDTDKLADGWRELLLNPNSAIGLGGTAVATAETLMTQLTVFGAVGLAVGGYALAYNLAQGLGYVSAPYRGPEWAFIYSLGAPASGRRRKAA